MQYVPQQILACYLMVLLESNSWAASSVIRDSQSVNPGILSYTVVCDYQKGPNKLEVLLPDGYTKNTHYPVVYMLPVNIGTSGQWGSSIVEAKKANLQNQYQMIFCCARL